MKNKIVNKNKISKAIKEVSLNQKLKNLSLIGLKLKIIFILIDIIEGLIVDIQSLGQEIDIYKFNLKHKVEGTKKLLLDFRLFFNNILKDYPTKIIEFGFTADKLKDFIFDFFMTDDYKAYIIWSVEDFKEMALQLKGENWKDFYNEDNFPEALDLMIKNHDCDFGITWDTIKTYLNNYCKV